MPFMLRQAQHERNQLVTVRPRLHGQIVAPAFSAFPTSLWVMKEVDRKPLLRFLHSPHPCGLATHGAVAESLSKHDRNRLVQRFLNNLNNSP